MKVACIPRVALAVGLSMPVFASAGPQQPDPDEATAERADHAPVSQPDQQRSEDGLRALLHDPKDGKLDMSRWLLDHRGFLPVPIVVSDPALGYGGGLGLALFHRPAGAATTRTTADGRQQMVSPNIYGVGGIKTENDSYAYGAGARMHFADDRWRYAGAIGKSSFNLAYYTPGRVLPSTAIAYNTKGVVSYQKVSRRLGDQMLYVGLSWVYMDQDLSFEVESDRQRFSKKELARHNSGLGLQLQYDQRDNALTPGSGWMGLIQGTFYGKEIGSDTYFQSYRGQTYGYLPMADSKFVLGGRLDMRWANGDIPFNRLPYIDLRGIGSARYQDTRAAVAETELRWNVTQRWALLGFTGAGRTWGRHNSFDDARSQVSKGTGFRYLVARQLGLYVGLDYAWGPEDETLYVQIGSAWSR